MELRHLRYFVAVAELLSFTRAAAKLRVAQPALSRQIRQLEEELGVQLLERNRRSTRLTEAGKVFLGESLQLLAHTERAVAAAQTSGTGVRGTLNLGYVWGLFHGLVPPIVARLRKQHPDLTVNLLDKTAVQQFEGLRDGTLDAGFIGFDSEAEGDALEKRKVASCSLVAALPEGHRAAKRRIIHLAALAEDLFLTISDAAYPGAARLAAECCRRAGFKPRTVQAADRGHTLLGLVAGGCGVALLPSPLRDLPHEGVVFRELSDTTSLDLFLMWKRKPCSRALEALLNASASQK